MLNFPVRLLPKTPDFPAEAFASCSSYFTGLRIVAMNRSICASITIGIGQRFEIGGRHAPTSIIVDADWIEFDRVAKRLKTDRVSLLRNYIEHTLGKADPPKIPAAA